MFAVNCTGDLRVGAVFFRTTIYLNTQQVPLLCLHPLRHTVCLSGIMIFLRAWRKIMLLVCLAQILFLCLMFYPPVWFEPGIPSSVTTSSVPFPSPWWIFEPIPKFCKGYPVLAGRLQVHATNQEVSLSGAHTYANGGIHQQNFSTFLFDFRKWKNSHLPVIM